MEQYTNLIAGGVACFALGYAVRGYLAYLQRTAYQRALKAAREALELVGKLKVAGPTAEELQAQRAAEEAAKAALQAQVAKL